MTIGVDIDGVLSRFETSYAPLVTKMFGIEFPRLGDPNWPDIWDWDTAAGVTPEQQRAVWSVIKSSPNFWVSQEAMPEARAVLARLAQMRMEGHDIYFITSRPGTTAQDQTVDWLEEHGFPAPNVLIANSSEEKASIAKRLQLELFFDDKPSNCLAVREAVPADVFIIDQPWNRDWDNDKEGILRAVSVHEVLDWALTQEKVYADAA